MSGSIVAISITVPRADNSTGRQVDGWKHSTRRNCCQWAFNLTTQIPPDAILTSQIAQLQKDPKALTPAYHEPSQGSYGTVTKASYLTLCTSTEQNMEWHLSQASNKQLNSDLVAC
jgi:hypothetical protein